MGKLTVDDKHVEVTTKRMNCWEFKQCGREPGGTRVEQLGVCPVTKHERLNGSHGGKNAGRACWVVAGSLCGGKIQGTFAQKLRNCWSCDFMNAVKMDEEPTPLGFSHTLLGMERALTKQSDTVSSEKGYTSEAQLINDKH